MWGRLFPERFKCMYIPNYTYYFVKCIGGDKCERTKRGRETEKEEWLKQRDRGRARRDEEEGQWQAGRVLQSTEVCFLARMISQGRVAGPPVENLLSYCPFQAHWINKLIQPCHYLLPTSPRPLKITGGRFIKKHCCCLTSGLKTFFFKFLNIYLALLYAYTSISDYLVTSSSVLVKKAKKKKACSQPGKRFWLSPRSPP